MAIMVTRPAPGKVQIECQECGLHLCPHDSWVHGTPEAKPARFSARHPHPDDLEDTEDNAHVRAFYNGCPNKGMQVEGDVNA
jgi:hypothetical protein